MNNQQPIGLRDAVRKILADSQEPLSPPQIKDRIKKEYPHLYNTESHRVGVQKGNYHDLDHALAAPIYNLVRTGTEFIVDRSTKPMRASLVKEDSEEDFIGEDLEAEVGTVYVLGTGTFTSDGRQIIKIGHTTQQLESRIAQLYTTGTPFLFKELHSWKVRNYIELEQAMHRLLAPFRISRAREFFTDECLSYVMSIMQTHADILNASTKLRPDKAL
jgi:T5orf172 domain